MNGKNFVKNHLRQKKYIITINLEQSFLRIYHQRTDEASQKKIN